MLKTIADNLLSLIYPPICLNCRKFLRIPNSTFPLCLLCRSLVRLNKPPFCLKCSRYTADSSLNLCKKCLHREFFFDQAWGCCLYEEPMKSLIHQFKYRQKTVLQYFFFDLIKNFLSTYRLDFSEFDMLVPVPLFPARQRERGFNQSELLARHLARALQVPLNLRYLARRQYTKTQAKLSQKERWTNLKGAFTIKYSSGLKSRSVLLIDDLFTTGATASEAAFTLKNAGAKRVGLLTLAIAMQD